MSCSRNVLLRTLIILLGVMNESLWGQDLRTDPNLVWSHTFGGLVEIIPAPMTDDPIPETVYTHAQSNGNRLVAGHNHLPSARVVDIALHAQAQWVVGYPLAQSSLWVVVLADGQIQDFILTGNRVESLPLGQQPFSNPTPPALGLINGSVQLMVAPAPFAAPHTHPLFLDAANPAFASLNQAGDLVLWQPDRVTHLLIDALTDSRLLSDETGRILALTNPSTRYGHGILADRIEPTHIKLIETQPCAQVVTSISIPSPAVIEGLSPIWADLDGDGIREILVTVSDAARGARLVAYTETGDQLATGPPIGRGYRWRHQLAVAPFGPDGETEIAVVLTPHIGGVVEFYRLVSDQLEIVAGVPGYSTHVIGSRNLDTALAADFDADGRIELLVPTQQFNTLGAIRRSADGAEVIWSVPVGGRMSTNLAAVPTGKDSFILGVGHSGKVLRLWVPQ